MENKVIIFGDSYANSEPVDWSWSNLLKQHYNVKNFAYAGSSDVYSRIKLFDYLQSEDYSVNDIILYFPTSLWRMNILSVFEETTMQSTYMTHAMNSLGMNTKAKEDVRESIQKDLQSIEDDPNFYYKYHEFLEKDTLNLYKQRLLNAKLLKDLPNFAIHYDTFYKKHEFLFNESNKDNLTLDYFCGAFENNIICDDDNFMYIKSHFVHECSNHRIYRGSHKDKIHNHMNKEQNSIFVKQIINTINSRKNQFDEEKIIGLYKPLEEL